MTTSAMILVATPVPAARADYSIGIGIGPLVGGQYGYVKCLQPVNGSLNAGDPIVIEPCNYSDAQQWSVLVSSNVLQFHLVNKASNLCMDAQGNAVNGTPIIQWPCDTISNEVWSLGKNGNNQDGVGNLASGIYNSQVAADRKQWTHCLAATYPGDIDGLPAELQACGGDILQQWNNPVPSAFDLRTGLKTDQAIALVNIGSGKCFAPNPAVASPGLPIQQQTCNGSAFQQWDFLPPISVQLNGTGQPWYCPVCISTNWTNGYFIQNVSTGLCMDVQDASTSDSSVVQQSTCPDPTTVQTNSSRTGSPGDKLRSTVWYIAPGDFFSTFKVRNLNSDHCLDVRDGSSDDGAQLQQYHCTSDNGAQNFIQTVVPVSRFPWPLPGCLVCGAVSNRPLG